VSAHADAAVVETAIPSRLDRLPWSRFHWLVVIGLGTVWILDGLEVTIVGSIGARLTQHGSGVGLTASSIGTAAAIYVAGACVGALFFGQLTDRFGRKRLFTITLALYIVATVATAFSFAPWYFFLCRFVTGMGIGGEYAAINSAIDELIPARVRGRVDLIINGTYWLGAAIGGLGSVLLLNPSIFPIDVGWRLAFGIGAILGLTMILIRRNVPESPRWLLIHGREEDAERIVSDIEGSISRETGEELPEPDGDPLTIRQRKVIPFREVAAVAFTKYPRRAILGLALFVGQAFLYNAVTFDLGTILSGFFKVAASAIPYFILLFAAGNLLGPLTLGRLFDTVGRKPMIAITYLGSAAVAVVLGVLWIGGGLDRWSFIAIVGATFFLASAGASSAYLTVSEIFPMETRALAIAFFYAVGTAIGGITGPLLFGHLIASGKVSEIATGFFIGAGVMAIGGIAELLFGVRSEQRSLEDIATPLTAEDGAAKPRGRRLERYRPGPGPQRWQPGMSMPAQSPAVSLELETGWIVDTLRARGVAASRGELERALGARRWGPGRFSGALRAAVREGLVRRVGASRYQLASPSPGALDAPQTFAVPPTDRV
jgi:MFS family permease